MGAHVLQELADDVRPHRGERDDGRRERRPDLGVDVVEVARDLSEARGPFDVGDTLAQTRVRTEQVAERDGVVEQDRPDARVVDDEVEGRPVACRLRQVLRVPVLGVIVCGIVRRRREAFMHADVAERRPLVPQNDLVLPDQLERRIHDLLVIEPPLLHRCTGRIRDLFGGQGHAVAFPRVRLVVVDLALDLEEVRRPRVEEAVGVEALGARELVDEISHAGRLVGRQHFDAARVVDVFRLFARHEHRQKAGDVAEQADRHLAVEVQRLDEGYEMENLEVHRVAEERRVPVSPEPARRVQIPVQRKLIEQRGGAGGTPERWIEHIRREFRGSGVPLRESPQRPVLREVALADHV